MCDCELCQHRRASGGPVRNYVPVRGETGPELFVPLGTWRERQRRVNDEQFFEGAVPRETPGDDVPRGTLPIRRRDPTSGAALLLGFVIGLSLVAIVLLYIGSCAGRAVCLQ